MMTIVNKYHTKKVLQIKVYYELTFNWNILGFF